MARVKEKQGFRFWWPKDAVNAAMEEYQSGLGSKHPERQITVAEFERRIKEFEAVVGEWMDDGKRLQMQTLARRWGKEIGLPSYHAVPCFLRLWNIVDSRFSIS
jgi:hypothetical protein